MRGKLSILTELQRAGNVRRKACRKSERKYNINNDNINVLKETFK